MAAFKPNPLGILKCRDLVELYYGFPMVGDVREQLVYVQAASGVTPVVEPDPRRIRLELTLANVNGAFSSLFLGTRTQMDTGKAAVYTLPAHSTLILTRDFLTDLDTVCLPMLARSSVGNWEVFVRETILTPTPIGEVTAAP
jgi:hypothetical protein